MRWRFEAVDSERKALQQALQETQATLRAEARRAGAAEALLRERTATLAAVARQTQICPREGSKRVGLKLRSSSSNSTMSVDQESQVDLQCAISARDKLMGKLSEKERESAELRRKEQDLRSQVASSAQEADGLRAQLADSEIAHSDMLRELDRTRVEQDRCREEANSQSAAHRAELDELKGRVRGLYDELAKTQELLEARSVEVHRLQQETAALEGVQRELDTTRELLSAKVAETDRVLQEKRALEVKFDSFKQSLGTGDNQQLMKIAELQVALDQFSRQVASQEKELGAQQGNSAELQSQNRILTEQLRAAEAQRVELHNAIQELKGNIRVYCRVRPAKEGHDLALHLLEPNRMSLVYGLDAYPFGFDKVFGMATEQQDVYKEVEGLVQSALDGYKVCIFAYGQTGSGKTYTMQGTDEPGESGLIPRSLLTIFKASEAMRAQGWQWSVQVSFMEVYNETLRDLLRGSGDAAAGPTEAHVIAPHEECGTFVTGMTCVTVESTDQIVVLMARAAKQRSIAATDMNATSSRSHSIFTLYLKGTNKTLNREVHGALNLVDLAGSERLDKSGSTGDRLKETRSINKSLSSLADVFAAKAQGNKHVPFRNSKLTHLLEPCLSGQGKTLMVVNVQPEQQNAHETLCSLRFAKQVSQCTTGGKARRSVRSIQPQSSPAPRLAATSQDDHCSSEPVHCPSPQFPIEQASLDASVDLLRNSEPPKPREPQRKHRSLTPPQSRPSSKRRERPEGLQTPQETACARRSTSIDRTPKTGDLAEPINRRYSFGKGTSASRGKVSPRHYM